MEAKAITDIPCPEGWTSCSHEVDTQANIYSHRDRHTVNQTIVKTYRAKHITQTDRKTDVNTDIHTYSQLDNSENRRRQTVMTDRQKKTNLHKQPNTDRYKEEDKQTETDRHIV